MPSMSCFIKNGKWFEGQLLSMFYFRVILKSPFTSIFIFQSHIKSIDSGETNIEGAIGE